MLIDAMAAFERRLRRRDRIMGGGIGRGAKPPSEAIPGDVPTAVKELVRSLREEAKAI